MLRRCILSALILGLALTLRPAGAISYGYAAASHTTANLVLPNGVAVDSNGNLFAADGQGSHKVDVYDPINHTLLYQIGSSAQFGTNPGPYGIAIDSFGNVFITAPGATTPAVYKFDHTGRLLLSFTGTTGGGTAFTNHCFGVAIDSNDNVFVSDESNKLVQKYDNYGNFLASSEFSPTLQFNNPYGIAIDSSNNVYVIDSGVGIYKLDDNLDLNTTKFLSNSDATNAENLAVDALGNLYILEPNLGTPQVAKYNSSGTAVGSFTSSGATSASTHFAGAFGLAVDANGDVLVADNGGASAGKVDVWVQRPTTTATFTPSSYTAGSLTLTTTGLGSPIHYNLDGGALTTYSSAISISDGNPHFITYYTVVGPAGITEDPQSLLFDAEPILFSISPDQIVPGNGNTLIVINGAGFGSSNFGSTYKIFASRNGGTPTQLTSTSVVNPNELIGTIPGPLVASAGPLDLYVTYSTASTSNDLVVDVGKAKLAITVGTITGTSTLTVPITIKNLGTADAVSALLSTLTLTGGWTYSSGAPSGTVSNGGELTGNLVFTGNGSTGSQTLVLKGNYGNGTTTGTFSLTATVTP